MMQSIKISLAILATTICVQAEQQIELKGGGVVDAVTSATEKEYKQFNSDTDLRYNGRFHLGESFLIEPTLTVSILPGANENEGKYFQQRTYPYVIDGAVTSRFINENHNSMLRFEGDITPESKEIAFPVLSADRSELLSASIKHRDDLGVATAYQYSRNYMTIGGHALYRSSSYNLSQDSSTSFYREGDLFYEGTAHAHFMDEQIYFGINYFAKNDLNSYTGYNWSYSSIETGTRLSINKRKTQIYSRIAFTNLKGDMVKKNNYTTGLGGDGYLRISHKVTRGLWLKANMDISARTEIIKSRLGASLRKAGKKGALEGGYWSTAGSLFPRQCGWVNGSVYLFEKHLELEPAVKNYWILDDHSYRYYRTDMAMTLHVLPIKNSRSLTLSTGGLWKNFKDANYFSSGVELFVGVATIL